MNSQAAWGPVVLRLMAGIGFMIHGFPKLFDAAYRSGFEETLTGLGLPNPEVFAWVVGIVEFVGGLSILLGIAVHFASLLLVVDMMVAIVKVHGPAGFNFFNVAGTANGKPVFGIPGYEINLLYIAILFSLMITGPGKFALFNKRKRFAEAPIDSS